MAIESAVKLGDFRVMGTICLTINLHSKTRNGKGWPIILEIAMGHHVVSVFRQILFLVCNLQQKPYGPYSSISFRTDKKPLIITTTGLKCKHGDILLKSLLIVKDGLLKHPDNFDCMFHPIRYLFPCYFILGE